VSSHGKFVSQPFLHGELEILQGTADKVLEAEPLNVGLELPLHFALPAILGFHLNKQNVPVGYYDKVGEACQHALTFHYLRLQRISPPTIGYGGYNVPWVLQAKPRHHLTLYL
jgi:hypothetical protein